MVKKSVRNELDAADHGTLKHDRPTGSRAWSQGAVIGVTAAVAVATGLIGFVGGIQFQKGSTSSTVANQQGGFGGGQGGMGGGMNRNGSFGEVTAISDDSITINAMQGGPNSSNSNSSTKTYTINSSTTITVDGSTGSVSDISTGDTVMIQAGTSDSSIAASIRVGMGGMPGNQGQTQSAGNQSTSATT